MSQTAYNQNMAASYAGMKADAGNDRVESYLAEETNGIPFGYGVVAGTDPLTQVKLPDADTDEFRGIALHTHKQASGIGASLTALYKDEDMVNVGRQIVAWVEVDEAVTVDAAAYCTTATGKFGVTSGAGHIAVPTGVFRSTTTGAGLAKLEINLP